MLSKIAPLSLNPKKTCLSLLSISSHSPLSLLSAHASLSSHASLSLLSLSILRLSSPAFNNGDRRICAGENTSVSRLRRRRSSLFQRNHIIPTKPHRSRILRCSNFTPLESSSSFVLRLCSVPEFCSFVLCSSFTPLQCYFVIVMIFVVIVIIIFL